MRIAGWVAIFSLASGVAAADVLLTMKSGERYELSQPARHKNGMLSFTTKDRRFLTVRESEVAREETIVPPPPKIKLDRTDTKQLGAIAREQRAERGITADVAGKDSARPGESGPSSKTSPEGAQPAPAPPPVTPRKKKHRTRRHSLTVEPAAPKTEEPPPPR